jgi:hypothetical protein
MRSTYPTTPAAADNLHRDGAIRCNRGFHSVIPEEGDNAELRVQILVPGAHVAALPTESISRSVQAALREAGIDVVAAQVTVLPPEHDCDALMQASA